jgi:hypothetical protein
MSPTRFEWLAPAAAVMVLAVMVGWKATLPDASVGAPFRARVSAALRAAPLQAGGWEGVDTALPREAVTLLHPGAYLCRRYTDERTGERAEFIVIHAEDARDMMGHYPPNCYPASGWEMAVSRAAHNGVDSRPEWLVGDLGIRGREYEFRRRTLNGEERLWVRNFFVLPNGMTYPDIGAFGRAAADFQIRPYGAAQVQVIYEREYTPEDRERIFAALIGGHRALIDVIRGKSGVSSVIGSR